MQYTKRTNSQGSRRYCFEYVDSKGETKDIKLPSVTSVLSHCADMEVVLEQWRNRVGKEEAANILKNSTKLGTNVDKLLEFTYSDDPKDAKKLKAKLKTSTSKELDRVKLLEEFHKYFNVVDRKGIVHYYDSNSSQGYAGEFDIIVQPNKINKKDYSLVDYRNYPIHIDDEELIVSDYKNLTSKKPIKYLIKYTFQVAAYIQAYNKMNNTNIKRGVLAITSPRTVEYYHITPRILDYYTKEFMNMVDCFYRRDKYDWNKMLARIGCGLESWKLESNNIVMDRVKLDYLGF